MTQCKVSNCEKPIRADFLACTNHWDEIPLTLQNLVKKFSVIDEDSLVEPNSDYVYASQRALEWHSVNILKSPNFDTSLIEVFSQVASPECIRYVDRVMDVVCKNLTSR